MYRLTASGAGLITLVVLFLIGLFLFLRPSRLPQNGLVVLHDHRLEPDGARTRRASPR